ncbi:MAG: hypothetical protein K0R53_3330, partial [Burkholderiales bacterium]|nr:hypothetical protein [Burkholderiales bacterium]
LAALVRQLKLTPAVYRGAILLQWSEEIGESTRVTKLELDQTKGYMIRSRTRETLENQAPHARSIDTMRFSEEQLVGGIWVPAKIDAKSRRIVKGKVESEVSGTTTLSHVTSVVPPGAFALQVEPGDHVWKGGKRFKVTADGEWKPEEAVASKPAKTSTDLALVACLASALCVLTLWGGAKLVSSRKRAP